MVSDNMILSAADLAAGAEYLKAIRRLKLEPDVMCWTGVPPIDENGNIDQELSGEKHLAIVSSVIDFAGPLAMNELLFKAYDASITPKEIDPFHVTLYSPRSAGGSLLMSSSKSGQISEARDFFDRHDGSTGAVYIAASASPLIIINIFLDGVYVAHKRPIAAEQSQRRFQIFKREVELRAA